MNTTGKTSLTKVYCLQIYRCIYICIYVNDAIQSNTYPHVLQRSTGGVKDVLPVVFITNKTSLDLSKI